MNTRCINKSLFILSLINKQRLTLNSTNSSICSQISRHSSNAFNSRSETSGTNVKTSTERDPQFNNFLSSDKHDPDSFGTLSATWKTQKELSALPDEEDDIKVTEFLHNKEGKTRLTTNKYGKIIKKFLAQKKIGQAIEVLETRMLKDDRAKPENYIYNLLIGACGKVGYTTKAFNLYKRMRDRRLKVTGHTYTGLFNACANSPYPEHGLKSAQHLRNALVEKGFLMNPTLYHAMIKAFGRCGDMETAFLLVDEMLEKKIMVTDETFNFLLQACITDKTAGFRQALLVWRKMLEKRVRPNLFSFNLLLRCSRDCGLGDEATALQVIQVLLQAGQKKSNSQRLCAPSVKAEEGQLTQTSHSQNMPNLISQEPSMGDVMIVQNVSLPEHRLMLMGGSSGILEQMKLYRVKPDIKTFTQLLDQIPSNIEAEIDLVDRVKQAKVSLDVDFCNMLMRKRCLRCDYENAKQVLRLIQQENLKPDMMTFGVLAMTCQSLTSAQQLLQDIDNLGYHPNIEILGTLLKNACYKRNCDFVLEIMRAVEREDLKPNEKFLKHLDNFFRFANGVLNKQLTDSTGVLNAEKFNEYCEFYRVWRRKMNPEDPPHPWEQFRNINLEPEDLELMNYGKVKYAK